nr:MAG TPA: Rubredoxin [Caudoviricetes sp.]
MVSTLSDCIISTGSSLPSSWRCTMCLSYSL